jgi:hypothetical protein
MNLLFAIYLFTVPAAEKQTEVRNYVLTEESFLNDGGFDYKKHNRKKKRKKRSNRLFNANNCRGVSHHA